MKYVWSTGLLLAFAACGGLQDGTRDAAPDLARDDGGEPTSPEDAGTSDAAADAARQPSDAAGDDDAADRVVDASVPEPDASLDGALCTSCGACSEEIAVTSAMHVSGGVDYSDPPPVGGPHDPCWKAFGAYDSEVPDERWVHSMEHGGVVLLHNCDDCQDEAAAMAAFANTHPQALATPYESLPARFAIVAWGVRLVSDCYDSDVFAAFYEAHVDHGPESITSGPPLSVCPP